MNIIIFGASGFIGNSLINHLLKKNNNVIGCSRNIVIKKSKKFRFYRWEFGQIITKKLLLNIDCAIHLSHDFNIINGKNKTINGTMKIVKFLNNAGVKHQFFFSSYSAYKNSDTNYGKTKFILEKKLKSFKNVLIIRPGLVLGNGGLCKKIKKILNNFPIFIIPFSKKFKVPVISIHKVCHIISCLLNKKYSKKEFNLFEKNFLSIENLFKKINKNLKFLLAVPLPIFFSIFFIKIIKFFAFNFNINHENVKGLLSNQYATHQTDIHLFR